MDRGEGGVLYPDRRQVIEAVGIRVKNAPQCVQ